MFPTFRAPLAMSNLVVGSFEENFISAEWVKTGKEKKNTFKQKRMGTMRLRLARDGLLKQLLHLK
jgi:hypothetical protein